jgi:glycogen synthase
MRLLLVNYEFPPLGAGAGNATAQIAKHLARKGHEALVLTSGMTGGRLRGREIRDGYEVMRIPTLRRSVERSNPYEMATFIGSGLLHAREAVRQVKAEAAIIFFGLPCGPIGWWMKRSLGLPYILSLRGGDIPGIPYGPLATYHRILTPLNRAVWRNASAIAVTSDGFQALAGRFAMRLGKRIMRIPNGVDCEIFYPPDSPRPSEAEVRVLYVGRVVREHKGLENLVPAFEKLTRESSRAVSLDIVGDGAFRSDLENLARSLGVEETVKFSGWVKREDLLAHYQAAQIFVLPSVGDGMTNSILEAMACGLPIVTTPSSGEHLVEDRVNGILVAPGDREGMAGALGSLLKDDEMRRRMGESSRSKALALSWESVARQYFEIAREACRRKAA